MSNYTYKTEYSCRACNSVLSYDTMMSNHGTCPKCGHIDKHGDTIVMCTSRAVRYRVEPYFFGLFNRLVLDEDMSHPLNKHRTR